MIGRNGTFKHIFQAFALTVACLLLPAAAHGAEEKTFLKAPSVEAAWKGVRAAVVNEQSPETFARTLDVLVLARDAAGLSHLEMEGVTLAQWAHRAAEQNDASAAVRYADAAVRIAPESPEGYLVHSRMAWEQGSYPDGLVWFAKGVWVGLNHYWIGTAWIGYGIVVFWIAAATTLLIFLVPSLVYTVRVFQHTLLEYCEFKVSSGLVMAGCFAVLLMPAAGGWGIGWAVLGWVLLAWMGDRAQERQAQIFLLLVLLLGPWMFSPIAALNGSASDPVALALSKTRGVNDAGGQAVPPPGEIEVNNWRLAYAFGNAALRDGQYKTAIKWYEQARAMGADPSRVEHNIATAYFKDGRVDDAERILQRLSGAEQVPLETLFNLGQVQSEKRNFKSARASFDRARGVDPERYLQLTHSSTRVKEYFVLPIATSNGDARLMMVMDTAGWTRFAEPLWHYLFGGLSMGMAPVILGVVVLLFLLLPKLTSAYRIYHCDICSANVCQECMRFNWDLHLCLQCSDQVQEARDGKAEAAILKKRHGGGSRLKGLLRLVPGLVALSQERYAVAVTHLLLLSFAIWWLTLLNTIPQWAVNVPMSGWPVARTIVGTLLAIYVLLAILMTRTRMPGQ